MLLKLKQAVSDHSMFASGDNLLVALSGGADSVALLLGLLEIKDEFKIKISAIHINHNLRGEESKRDENFCRNLCEQLNVQFIVESVDINSLAKEMGESTELCARNVRYALFNKHSNGIIATAHTASDNAETVIYNLCRGSGIKGLCGIPPKRENIVRPLIYCSRNDIERYLNQKQQSYVVDSTNLGNDYTRNKIRHFVIPSLLEINPSLFDTVSMQTELLRNDNLFLEKQANEAYNSVKCDNYLSSEITQLDTAILSRVLQMYYKSKIDLSSDSYHIFEMIKVVKGKIKRTSLKENKVFSSFSKGFIIEDNSNGHSVFHKTAFLNSEILNFFKDTVKIGYNEYKNLSNVNNLLLKFSIDCDKIVGDVVVRTRAEGDKYRPVGRKVTKSIRKLLTEYKCTNAQKNSLLLLCDQKGIIFTNLFGIDERVSVSSDSQNIYAFDFSKGVYENDNKEILINKT